MEMWTGQLPFSETSFGQKRPCARPPKVKPPRFQSFSWDVRNKTTSAKSQRVLGELGWSKFGKMCLPRVRTMRCWWVVWCAGSQTLMRHKDVVSNGFHTCSQRPGLSNYHSDFKTFQLMLIEPPLFPGSIPGWITVSCCLFVLFWALLKPWRSKSCLLESSRRGNGSTSASWLWTLDNLAAISGGVGQTWKSAQFEYRCWIELIYLPWSIST